MDDTQQTQVLDASFDIVARQDATDAAIETLRTDVEDVKTRLDRVGRAAVRPMIGGGTASVEVKSFVDGYLRQGRETR